MTHRLLTSLPACRLSASAASAQSTATIAQRPDGEDQALSAEALKEHVSSSPLLVHGLVLQMSHVRSTLVTLANCPGACPDLWLEKAAGLGCALDDRTLIVAAAAFTPSSWLLLSTCFAGSGSSLC